jgi:hypothetical protein
MTDKDFTTGILGDLPKLDAEKVKELINLLESNKIEEKIVCVRLEIGDLIFIPKSQRLERDLNFKPYIGVLK